MFQFINLKSSVDLKEGKVIPFHSLVGNIEFNNVTFSYPTRPGQVGMIQTYMCPSACIGTEVRFPYLALDPFAIYLGIKKVNPTFPNLFGWDLKQEVLCLYTHYT